MKMTEGMKRARAELMTLELANRILRPFKMTAYRTIGGTPDEDGYGVRSDASGSVVTMSRSLRDAVVDVLTGIYDSSTRGPLPGRWRRASQALVALGVTPNPDAQWERRQRRRRPR